MRRNSIRVVIVLGAFAIVGIILVQYFMIRRAWNASEKQFNQSIQIALKNVAAKIAEYNQSLLPQNDLVNKISSAYYVVNTNSEIDANLLEHFLITEFETFHININFEYAIYDCSTDKMVYGDYVNLTGKNNHLLSKKSLPKYNDYVYYFGVHFPSRQKYIAGNMTVWFVFSVILLIAVVFFAYSIFIIMQQKRLSEMQKDFINNMTHEFKTPISSINISADVLLDPETKKSPARLDNYAAIIKQENNRLNDQVEKVLQIARIERNAFELNVQETDLHEILKEVLSNITLKDKGNNCVFQKELLANSSRIIADPLHVANLFYNLFDNAIKYCRENLVVSIRTQSKKLGIEVVVSDNGLGIAKEHAKRIFEKFYRVPTGNLHDVKGFGLGLYYVKNICKEHGWQISLKTEVGKGCTFTIFIPQK